MQHGVGVGQTALHFNCSTQLRVVQHHGLLLVVQVCPFGDKYCCITDEARY